MCLFVAFLFVAAVCFANGDDEGKATFQVTNYPELTPEVLNMRYGTDSLELDNNDELDGKPDSEDVSEEEVEQNGVRVKRAAKIPASFEIMNKTKWNACKGVFAEIQNVANCGGGWAMVVAQMISDRRCIVYKKPKPLISSWDIISCCVNCRGSHDPNNGCRGGTVSKAMKWYQTKGVVTGGAFGEGGCKPYPLTMDDPVFPSSTPCEKKCNSNYTTKSYKKDKHKAKKRFNLKTEKAIKKEILARGSVVTTIKAYSDFGGYQSGIYHHTTGGTTNQHTYGRIVGWGVENGVKYWKVGHVWGSNWGEQGYFRIIRGINHCEVESRAMAVTVKKD